MNAVLISVLEIMVVGFTVWALFHEDRLVDFERRLACAARRRHLRIVKGSKSVDKYCA